MSIPDLCIYFVIGLVSVAYPILLQVIATLDEKYASIVIVELFKKEQEYRYFRGLLVAALVLIGLYAVTNLSVSLNKIPYQLEFVGYGLLLVTALLILTFLLFISKILVYYTPSRIAKYFIDKKIDQNFEFFNALADILYFAIDKNQEGIAVLIHDYYYKAFAKVRDEQKGAAVVYPQPYYLLVNNIINRLGPVKNAKFSFLEHRAIGGIWLLGELQEVGISEETLGIIWRMLMTAVSFQRDDLIMHWWANAHQVFTYYLGYISEKVTFDEGVETVHNKAEVDKRNAERERFLEFNTALGGMLLFKNRLDCIRRIFSYTSSTPPDYVLLPIHMNQVFHLFFKFWDVNHDNFPFISQRYRYPETEGLRSEDLVKIWTCKFGAVLLLRQYSIISYYTYVKPLELPSVPTTKSERRNWIDNLSYLESYVKEQYENRDLLMAMGWEKLTDEWLAEHHKIHPLQLIADVKKHVTDTDDRIDRERELDIEAIDQLKANIKRIITETYEPFTILSKNPLKGKIHTYEVNGIRTLVEKIDVTKDKDLATGAYSVVDQIQGMVSETFLFPKQTKINVKEDELFKAIARLAPDPNEYVIISFGYDIDTYINYHKVKKLTANSYHGLKLYSFPQARSGRRLYLIKKDDLPYLFTSKPIPPEISKYKLEEIGNHDLYFSIIDLFRNTKVKNEWLAEAGISDEQRADIEKMAQVYIASHANMLWKEDIDLICIAVRYDSMEKMTDINTLEKLTRKA